MTLLIRGPTSVPSSVVNVTPPRAVEDKTPPLDPKIRGSGKWKVRNVKTQDNHFEGDIGICIGIFPDFI